LWLSVNATLIAGDGENIVQNGFDVKVRRWDVFSVSKLTSFSL
jgi:hypothetical protein